MCVCVAYGASDNELCAVEENTEKCYREGLEVVSEPALLWRHYIRWCQKRVEDKHVTDAARLRVSWPFCQSVEKERVIISSCYLRELANVTQLLSSLSCPPQVIPIVAPSLPGHYKDVDWLQRGNRKRSHVRNYD